MSFIREFIELAESIADVEINNVGDVFELVSTAQKAIDTTVSSIAPRSTPQTASEPEESSTQVTLSPSFDNKIPVLYGTGFTKGIVTDARLGSNGLDLWVCYALSETTGDILSTGVDDGQGNITYTPSEISVGRVFIDGYEAVFKPNGITVDYIKDTARPVNTDTSMSGLIDMYFFKDGSENQTAPFGFEAAGLDARDVFPKWGFYNRMTDLAFVIVKVTYSESAELTKLPEFTFELSNTLVKPGDVIYDYLTNTRYGAGLPAEDINV